MTNPSLVPDGPKSTPHYHIIPYYFTVWTAFHMANTWKMCRKKNSYFAWWRSWFAWLIMVDTVHSIT